MYTIDNTKSTPPALTDRNQVEDEDGGRSEATYRFFYVEAEKILSPERCRLSESAPASESRGTTIYMGSGRQILMCRSCL